VEPSRQPAGSATDAARAGVRVAIALGSNLGERRQALDAAVAALRSIIHDVRVSRYYDTTPVGVPAPQPDYLNAAAVGVTPMSPHALLDALQHIERQLGRERPFVNAPRTIDLDLILYGSAIVSEPGLRVPHPRFRERAFVLDPLAEIGGDLMDPVTGESVRALQADLKRRAPAAG
jgi:2-amino-4-hydroxy-6-hydroxymethyldihydropteridine diphosphokinase